MNIIRRAWYNLKSKKRRYAVVFVILFVSALLFGGDFTAGSVLVCICTVAAAASILSVCLWNMMADRDSEIRVLRSIGAGWLAILTQVIIELIVPLLSASAIGVLISGARAWEVLGANTGITLIALSVMSFKVKEYLPHKYEVKK